MRYLQKLLELVRTGMSDPKFAARQIARISLRRSAATYAKNYLEHGASPNVDEITPDNPLREYFDNHTEGPGIWKWNHYFDIYHRHFAKFRGRSINVLEVGIYSGGSLGMWRSYFGPACHLHGVDIEPACKCYESEYTTVYIGDQSDRNFWASFRQKAPPIDILIDDGSHSPDHQRVTLEEMLPYLRRGGVYFCEDIHGNDNAFPSYVAGLVDELNDYSDRNEIQKSLYSIHFYPFCVVIEKHGVEPEQFVSSKHGTQWQPFFDK